MEAVPLDGAEPVVLMIAGAAFGLVAVWMMLRAASGGGPAQRTSALVVFLAGAVLLALPWFSAGQRSGPATEPEPVAAVEGIALSDDGLRTVATPAMPRPPPLPGRQAARIAIEASEAEPNDNLAVANPAELGTAISGMLDGGDLDYFAVDVPAATRGEIVVNLVALEGDAELTLFDDAGQALGSVRTRSALSLRTITLVRRIDRPRYHVLVLAAPAAGAAYQLTIAARRR